MTTRSNEKGRTNLKGTETKDFKGIFEIFSKENLGSVRTIFENDIPWFCLPDVCKILGLSNPSKAVKSLDQDERANFKLGRQGNTNFISESGLYTLIMRSRKPEAKIFKQWITKEVIPTIRKHGYYSNIPQIDEKDFAMLSIIKSVSEEERSIAFSKYQERFVIPMEKELEAARPKVETYNEFLDAEGTANTTTIAKSFGLPSGRLLNEIMHFEGFIVKIGSGWGPAKKYVDAGIMKPIEFNYINKSNKNAENIEINVENKNPDTETEKLPVALNQMEETTELTVIEDENKASGHQGKGLTFRWTLVGIEAIKEVLLSKNHIVKNDGIYSGNNETLKEFKKKYKEWKEKK